jgi:TM2 domain-containing membrane protein YozV
MAKRDAPSPGTAVAAGLLAWLIPGAGHVYLGRVLRGVIICVCINGLFWAGVAFGGVFTVDPIRQRLWCAAQMATGVSALGGLYREKQIRQQITDELGLAPTPQQSQNPGRWWISYNEAVAEKHLALVYPTDAVARSYTGIAGMLNLLCIFDAVMLALLGRLGEPPPEPRKAKSKPEPPT